MYKLYTFFVGCNASVLPLQHFTFVLTQIVLTIMKRMLNRMLRYADAIVKRGVDKLIDAIGQSVEPQTENTETPQQKSMGNDTDCTPEVQRHDQAYKGGVPVSKLVRNTMVIASFNGAESDEVRILWCSMRFAANAENIRTKGHKNKRNNVCVSRLARKT